MNEGLANNLGIEPCPFCGVGNCSKSCEAARRGAQSSIAGRTAP